MVGGDGVLSELDVLSVKASAERSINPIKLNATQEGKFCEFIDGFFEFAFYGGYTQEFEYDSTESNLYVLDKLIMVGLFICFYGEEADITYVDDADKNPDPRNYYTHEYKKMSAEQVDFAAKNILNCSDYDIKSMKESGEKREINYYLTGKGDFGFYEENGYYYVGFIGGVGSPTTFDAKVNNSYFDGEYY